MRRLRIGARAQRHIREAMAAYAADYPGRDERFEEAIDRGFALVTDAPFAGAALPEGLRVVPLERFPYSIVYAVAEATVDVVAVPHHKRRPGSWRDEDEP